MQPVWISSVPRSSVIIRIRAIVRSTTSAYSVVLFSSPAPVVSCTGGLFAGGSRGEESASERNDEKMDNRGEIASCITICRFLERIESRIEIYYMHQTCCQLPLCIRYSSLMVISEKSNNTAFPCCVTFLYFL